MTCNLNLFSQPLSEQHVHDVAIAEDRLVATAKARDEATLKQMRLSQSISGCNGCNHCATKNHEAENLLVLQEAMLKLPEIFQQIIRLYDIEQQDVQTIGESLGISPKRVSSVRQIALRRFRSILTSMDYHPH